MIFLGYCKKQLIMCNLLPVVCGTQVAIMERSAVRGVKASLSGRYANSWVTSVGAL